MTARPGWYPAPDGTDRDQWWNGSEWGEYAPGSRVRRSVAYIWVLIGAGAIGLGAFLPWVEATAPLVGKISRTGVDWTSDAGVNVAIACAALAMGAYARGGLSAVGRLVVLVLALAVFVPTLAQTSDIADRVSRAQGQSSLVVAAVGIGIYVTFGGVGALLLGVASVPKRPKG